ncbi:hypothetical protein L208DRAFT_1298510, partial [Tricholoma matsutake]
MTSRVLLRDVLYAPTMGVMLVSISCITKAGSNVLFTGDTRRIFNKDWKLIGKIKVLTIDELHHHMCHVSRSGVRALVQKKLMSSIELDESSEATICESCKWAKGVQKKIQKTCDGDCAEAVGNEVHLDLWGPAPVETINRKEYYVSFTNDHS